METMTPEEMDLAAKAAEAELADLNMTEPVANWWKRWYPKAGHRRLGRILLKYASREK